MFTPFSARRIWITGASTGIGRALAVHLAQQGARVAASARNQAALDEVVAQVPGQIVSVPLDVTDQAAHLEAAATVAQALGGIDLAIFNAGNCEYVSARTFDSAIFERMIRVNYLSVVYGIEAVLPYLRQSSCGHLAATSSAAAYGGLPRAAAYGAAKAAVRNLLEALRFDLAKENIAVSVICPGFVRTPLTDRNDFPMPFLLEPEDAARRIARGLARRVQEIHFPRRFTWMLKTLACLPRPWYTRIMSRLVRR